MYSGSLFAKQRMHFCRSLRDVELLASQAATSTAELTKISVPNSLAEADLDCRLA